MRPSFNYATIESRERERSRFFAPKLFSLSKIKNLKTEDPRQRIEPFSHCMNYYVISLCDLLFEQSSTTIVAIVWLFNPLVIIISCRGNADVVIALLVLGTFFQKQNFSIYRICALMLLAILLSEWMCKQRVKRKLRVVFELVVSLWQKSTSSFFVRYQGGPITLSTRELCAACFRGWGKCFFLKRTLIRYRIDFSNVLSFVIRFDASYSDPPRPSPLHPLPYNFAIRQIFHGMNEKAEESIFWPLDQIRREIFATAIHSLCEDHTFAVVKYFQQPNA